MSFTAELWGRGNGLKHRGKDPGERRAKKKEGVGKEGNRRGNIKRKHEKKAPC